MSIRHFLTLYSVNKTLIYTTQYIVVLPLSPPTGARQARFAARLPGAGPALPRGTIPRLAGSARTRRTAKPRNPRHFGTIEGGRVYQALHIDS